MLYTKGEGRRGPTLGGSQASAMVAVEALAEGSGEEWGPAPRGPRCRDQQRRRRRASTRLLGRRGPKRLLEGASAQWPTAKAVEDSAAPPDSEGGRGLSSAARLALGGVGLENEMRDGGFLENYLAMVGGHQ
jgi:hypothetical protein